VSNGLETYVPPSINKTGFNCPYCRAFAHQLWYRTSASEIDRHGLPEIREQPLSVDQGHGYTIYSVRNLHLSQCLRCERFAVWCFDQMTYPRRDETEAPPANPDLPNHIRKIYDEAASILSLSPRGAAGLLRLAIQVLCKELGQPGKNINADIKALVAEGLDPKVQKALDSIRVFGNNAVHPGEVDISDDPATAGKLFLVLNIIGVEMFSKPKLIDEIYGGLPQESLSQIERRDATARASDDSSTD